MSKLKPGDVMEEWTKKMSIEITGIPKECVAEIANAVGCILQYKKLKFDYGGIGQGFTDKICGIEFDVKDRR